MAHAALDIPTKRQINCNEPSDTVVFHMIDIVKNAKEPYKKSQRQNKTSNAVVSEC